MTIELLAPLTIRLNGQDREYHRGEVLDLPTTNAHRLLKKAPGLVRCVALTLAPPLHPGWLVAYRDRDGRLCGGVDDRAQGTVHTCMWVGNTWMVTLTNGQRLSLVAILSVRKTDAAGAVVAAWTVRAHGYDGEGRR